MNSWLYYFLHFLASMVLAVAIIIIGYGIYSLFVR